MDNVINTTAEPVEADSQEEVDDGQQLKFGYVVGLRKNGKFYFDVTGDTLGVIELMGLHSYASQRVKNVVATNQGTGDAISLEILSRLDALTKAFNKAVTIDKDPSEVPSEGPKE